MRFATVPMEFELAGGTKKEEQTWFITIDDEKISSEPETSRRKELLLDAFRDWHGKVLFAVPEGRTCNSVHCSDPGRGPCGGYCRYRGEPRP